MINASPSPTFTHPLPRRQERKTKNDEIRRKYGDYIKHTHVQLHKCLCGVSVVYLVALLPMARPQLSWGKDLFTTIVLP